jgi:hypothetical protein
MREEFISKIQYLIGEYGYKFLCSTDQRYSSPLFQKILELKILLDYLLNTDEEALYTRNGIYPFVTRPYKESTSEYYSNIAQQAAIDAIEAAESIEGNVLGTILTGYTDGPNQYLNNTNTILDAFGRLQTQIKSIVITGGGGVNSVSVVSANGFSGTVANATTTPAITLSTTITGLLKGNGTAISSAIANTDYQLPINLTTTGSSGSATFSSNTLNIPTYTLTGLGGVPTSTTITINGTALDLSANRSYNVGTITSITGGTGITGGTITTSGTLAFDTVWGDARYALSSALSSYVPTSRTITINGTSFDLSLNRSFSVGTVTSIIAGTGLSGGTITSSGTISFDTTWGDARYTLSSALASYVLNTRTITINGTSFDLSANRSFNVGTVTSLSVVSANGFAGSVATSTTTPAITISTTITGLLRGNGTAISAAVAGTDFQSPISLTTTGSSGAATFLSNTLNIPNYTLTGLGGVPTTRTISINGTTQDLSVNRTWTVGNVRTDSSYADPAWITSLSWSKITDRAITLSGYGITDAVNKGGDTMTGFLTLHADPTQALHAATKEYVDNVAAGLKAAPAVEVATTTSLSATYNNGSFGVGATLTSTTNGAFPTIDGVTISTTVFGQNGILIKNQSNPAHNGRYNLTTQGTASTPWVLTRCGVCDEADEIPGSYIFVKAGTTQGNTGWVAYVTNPSTYVVGTDPIFYFQFSGAGTYQAGAGLTLTGNVFSANIGTDIQAYSSDLAAIAALSGSTGYLVKNGTGSWSLSASPGGANRVISVITTNTVATFNSGVDYFYLASNTISITLPTAIANQSIYTIKNNGTGVITINTTSSQTIDGSISITLPVRYEAVSLVSDGSNWNII